MNLSITGSLILTWCRRRESNSHGLSPTTPSRWRVYQFHHFGKEEYLFIIKRRACQQEINLACYFLGVAGWAGACGTCCTGGSVLNGLPCEGGCIGAADFFWTALVASLDDMIEELPPFPDTNARVRDVSMKITAALVVNLLKNVVPPPAPKTD